MGETPTYYLPIGRCLLYIASTLLTHSSVLLKMSGLQKELAVSDDLAKILVTKRLWAYLKENKLQDPQNKQWFTPDETMAPIFGTEKIKCFSMAKYLKEHLTNPAK